MPEDTTVASAVPPPAKADARITPETVRHLASLARIAVSDDEITQLAGDLDSIVQHIAKVSAVASDSVPVTRHPIPISNVTRSDEVADVLTQEQALANAPDTVDGMFRVPSILGEAQ